MDRDELKGIIKEVIDEGLKPLFIEREQHYQDHLFIRDLREFVDSIKSTALKTIVRVVIVAILGLLAVGFAIWSQK